MPLPEELAALLMQAASLIADQAAAIRALQHQLRELEVGTRATQRVEQLRIRVQALEGVRARVRGDLERVLGRYGQQVSAGELDSLLREIGESLE